MDGAREQPRGGGPTSSAQIMEGGSSLPLNFIRDQLGLMAKYIAELAREWRSPDNSSKELVDVLKRIARDLDNDKELQRMMATDRVLTAPVFFHVATQIFSDGITWGRVTALFYFASRLVFKALSEKVPELIKTVVGWTLDFLQERLLGWVHAQSGWAAHLLQYSGTVKWLVVAAAIAGTGALVFFRFRAILA
ncbi:Apoptosis regulator BAX [Galemys pyrenaicus]|uniref:Apoptosis regulator BAX n=1 Tax=Galemys pyrenaicus TaxID=202257 RepID=A0A8J6AGS1_GALPY|nr:Apoptosis regulator BAX [Galemys pyrenaicus]